MNSPFSISFARPWMPVIVLSVVFMLALSLAIVLIAHSVGAAEEVSATENILDIEWNENSAHLLVLNRNNTLSVYDAKTARFIVSQKPLNLQGVSVIRESDDGIFTAVASYPDGKSLVVSIFKSENLINAKEPVAIAEYRLEGKATGLTRIHFSKDGKFVFVNRGAVAIHVLKTEETNARKIILGENETPRDVAEMYGERIAIINERTDNVVIVDFSAGKVLKRLPVGAGPRKILYNDVTKRLYVSHLGSDDVHVIDGKTFARIAVLKVGGDPDSMAYDRESGIVFVANDTAGTLNAISPTLAVKTVDLHSTAYTSSDYPFALFYLNAQKKLFILNPTEGKLIIYDATAGEVVKELKTDPRPAKIVGSESLQKIFVSHSNASSLWIADGGTFEVSRAPEIVSEDKSFFSRPHSIAIDAQGNRVFVSNLSGNFITVIDGKTQKPVTKIAVNTSPQIIAFNPPNKKLYAVSPVDNTLTVVDTSSPDYPVKFIPTGRQPNSMTLSADLGRLYISNSGDSSITVIDTTAGDTVIATIPFPGKNFPLVSAVARNGLVAKDKLYVALYGSANIAVVNTQTNKVEKMIPVGENPIWVRLVGWRMVVATEGNKKLTFIHPTTDEITGSISFDDTPYRIFSSAEFRTSTSTLVGAEGYLYVIFRRKDNVAAIKMNLTLDG